jgi:predicted DNA-binding protein (MmcQ/YjbR family)
VGKNKGMGSGAGDAQAQLVAELRELCKQFPGSEEYVMVHHPAFRVGKKPFVIAGIADSAAVGLSINLGHEAQAGLLDDERFSKTPYIGQHGWVTVARAALQRAELAELVTSSWRRVAKSKQLAEFDAGAREVSKRRKPSK